MYGNPASRSNCLKGASKQWVQNLGSAMERVQNNLPLIPAYHASGTRQARKLEVLSFQMPHIIFNPPNRVQWPHNRHGS